MRVSQEGTALFGIVWLLETLAYCVVDGYGLISGYNTKEKGQNFTRIIRLWFQVFFYSFAFSLLLNLIGLKGKMNLKELIKMAFPATFAVYWYFSAYLPLAILEPYIYKGLNSVDDRGLRRLFVLIIGIFCFSGLLFNGYNTESGYSFIWLLLLYVLGYSIKRLGLFEKWSNFKLVSISALLIIVSWLPMFLFNVDILINYISPTIVFNAIFLLIIFSRIKPNIRFVKVVAPLTFGIYLFQNNRIIWDYLKNLFVFVKDYNLFIVFVLVFLLALMVFAVGGVVDYLRVLLFKFVKMDKISS